MDAPRDEQTEERTRLSGAMVTNLLEAMAERFGADALARAMERIPEHSGRELSEAMPISMVPIASCEHLLHALAEETGRDVHRINREVNRHATARTFSTLWRLVLKLTSEDRLFSEAQRYFARAYDQGRLVVERDGRAGASLRVRDRPGMTRLAREGFAEGVCELLRLKGRRDVRAETSPHPDGADVHITWRPS
ncbi:MAG TPA: hypothetical protein RMH99_29010 [Sandaracinaceae bacterium LLY-WYZ-13_1]|nr:hypothetical protein [Sandaracinaceae bacterium LLY-WYZ-13_1]